MNDNFYITTPIYYVNAKPHLGHAYTTIVADVINRFYNMKGYDTFFLTGTDEHGDKVVKSALKENLGIKAYVDYISDLFKQLWPTLSIGYDRFIRTTETGHKAFVKDILQKIYDSGDIYFSEYEGLYCYGCERFYTERELINGNCPDHNTAPERIKESNYFFKMSRYQDWWIQYIHEHPDIIRPERYKNEVLSFLKDPLEDLCISRPKSRLKWGITLPFDNNYVTYVWFDALLNYISALGYPDGELFKQFWPVANHIVAKDILKPHGIYWPIILKAAGIPIYKHLNVHGYWNIDQSKMSKTVGNVVDPLAMKNIYGTDAFRYFVIREMVFGLDADFNEPAMILRINSDLANDLGNLFSRTITMVHKYCQGIVPTPPHFIENNEDFKPYVLSAINDYMSNMEIFAFHKAHIAIWELISHMNKYIDITAPWELAKQKKSTDTLHQVLYNLLEGLRIISCLIFPVMPETYVKMSSHLGQSTDIPNMTEYLTWGKIKPGTQLLKSISLFPRIEAKPHSKEDKSSIETRQTLKPEISFETFQKIDFRVGVITHAETIRKSKKLLKLTVDIGETRSIAAGLSTHYKPEDLIGKQVVVVANLKPAKLMGVLSQGMVLAAVNDNETCIIGPDKLMAPGTSIQ